MARVATSASPRPRIRCRLPRSARYWMIAVRMRSVIISASQLRETCSSSASASTMRNSSRSPLKMPVPKSSSRAVIDEGVTVVSPASCVMLATMSSARSCAGATIMPRTRKSSTPSRTTGAKSSCSEPPGSCAASGGDRRTIRQANMKATPRRDTLRSMTRLVVAGTGRCGCYSPSAGRATRVHTPKTLRTPSGSAPVRAMDPVSASIPIAHARPSWTP